ncbi:MAG: hypothetical protein ABI852_07785 [Gemmatimonadaceae bacterium]
MKITTIFSAGILMLATVPALAAAQAPTKSAMVDSTNKQLQHASKPPKSAVGTQALIAQPNGKVKHNTAAPAITPTAPASASLKAARTAAPTDSATKTAPPVQRAPVTTKKKPPAQ